MVEGGGILTLRDAEPYALANPTGISGTIDAPDEETGDPGTGAITAGTFATPRVSIEQDIVTPIRATVYIDADFSLVTPENLTGTVDQEGNVSVQTKLTVDLHIEVGSNPPAVVTDCRATPITLGLNSTAPYDPVTKRVTLANGSFSIPAVPEDSGCNPLVIGAVNEQLAGSGHAISLTMEGDLPLPREPKEPALASLAVSPAESAMAGDPVTLTATVAAAPDAEAEADPTGTVTFRDGGRVLDTVTLEPDGTAQLVTTALLPGTRSLNVRYGGDEAYDPKVSEPVPYVIFSDPALTWDLPGHVLISGGATHDFSVTATNTGFGTTLANARLDVTIQRATGTGPIGPIGSDPRIILERVDGEAATAVPLAFASSRLTGSIGAGTGVPLAPGEDLTEALRLGFPEVGTTSPTACGASNRLCPGPLRVTFTLQLVDPGTGTVVTTLASEAGDTVMVESVRRPATIIAGAAGFPQGGIPATPSLSPHTVRAGNNITLNRLNLDPALAGVRPSGTLTFLLDGKPVGVRPIQAPLSAGYASEMACCPSSGISLTIPVPADTAPGSHTLTVRFGGDDLFAPVQASYAVNVVDAVGPVYECQRAGLGWYFVGRASLVAQGGLPPVVPRGAEVPVTNPVLRLLFDRGPTAGAEGTVTLGQVVNNFTGFEVITNLGGTSSATGATRTNETRMDAAGDPDLVVAPAGLAMGVTVDGEPGETIPITVEELRFGFEGLGDALTCRPVGDPAVLDHVTVAATTLAVSPSSSAREGREVTLDAVTAPVTGGVVEFRDGATTIGVVPVDFQGRASMTTSTLPAGARSLTARYLGGFGVPSTTSPAVGLEVVPTACEEFADPGSAAVVRLVYLELLGRCPDQAGFEYWTGRLDGGTSAEAFARAIAATPEAVGRVVDDAYRTMLGRPAEATGRAFWTGRLQASGRYDRLLADLGASDEFWTQAGTTNAGFVTRVYERLLGRAPDAAGLDYWVGRLDAGTSRRVLILTLAVLDEPLGRLVALSYDEILDRVPTAGERADGIAHLRATGDRSGLYAQLIGRPEFATRAGTFPNPGD